MKRDWLQDVVLMLHELCKPVDWEFCSLTIMLTPHTGGLLLFIGHEATAFACLASLAADVVPGFYSPAMVAPQVGAFWICTPGNQPVSTKVTYHARSQVIMQHNIQMVGLLGRAVALHPFLPNAARGLTSGTAVMTNEHAHIASLLTHLCQPFLAGGPACVHTSCFGALSRFVPAPHIAGRGPWECHRTVVPVRIRDSAAI